MQFIAVLFLQFNAVSVQLIVRLVADSRTVNSDVRTLDADPRTLNADLRTLNAAIPTLNADLPGSKVAPLQRAQLELDCARHLAPQHGYSPSWPTAWLRHSSNGNRRCSVVNGCGSGPTGQ
eukprot:gene10554-biopygen9347